MVDITYMVGAVIAALFLFGGMFFRQFKKAPTQKRDVKGVVEDAVRAGREAERTEHAQEVEDEIMEDVEYLSTKSVADRVALVLDFDA